MNLLGMQIGVSMPALFYSLLGLSSLLLIYAYLRKGRAKRVVVASTIFLKMLENIPKARQKFLPPWRFFLELLLVLLLVGAAAGFYVKGLGDRIVILVDNSASMGALPSKSPQKQSLLQIAKEKAAAEINIAGWGSKFNVYVTSPEFKSLVNGFVDKNQALSIVNNVKQQDFSDNLQVALDQILAIQNVKNIVVLSDKSLEKSTGNKSVSWLNVKTYIADSSLDNAALLEIKQREKSLGRENNIIDVGVYNYSKLEHEALVRLSSCESQTQCSNAKVVSEKPLRVKAGHDSVAEFSVPPGSNQVFRIELLNPGTKSLLTDSLAADNIAYLSTSSVKAKILLVSSIGPDALGLNAIPTLDVEHVAPNEFNSFKGSRDLKEFSSIIFHRNVPENLPDSNLIFVTPPSNKFFQVKKTTSAVDIASWKDGHPLLSYLNVAALKIPSLMPLEKPPITEELMSTPYGTAAFAGESNGRRIVAFGFEIFPYEGKKSPLLSVLALNTFKWISEISSEVGFQRQDNPILITDDIQSITLSSAGEIYKRDAQVKQQRVFVEKPGLLTINRGTQEQVHTAVRFYNPEESNLNELQKISLQESSDSKGVVEETNNEFARKSVIIVFFILLLDLLFKMLKVFWGYRSSRSLG